MSLADWDVVYISPSNAYLSETDAHSVHGLRSLFVRAYNDGKVLGIGYACIVHTKTYEDAPLNVQIDTWISQDCILAVGYGGVDLYIGGIARKQLGVNSYFRWHLKLTQFYNGNTAGVDYDVGYVIDGTYNRVAFSGIGKTFAEVAGVWGTNVWRLWRIKGVESSGEFVVSVSVSPDISTPDVLNPPVDELVKIFSYPLPIPPELEGGGACGLTIGDNGTGYNTPVNSSFPLSNMYVDYTQIYY